MKKIILTLALLSSHGAYANTMNVDSITYDDFHKQIVEANKQSTNKQIQDIENEIVINNTSHKFFILDSDRVKPVSTDYYKEIMTYKNEDIDKASFVINSRLVVKELQKQGYVYHYYLKHCDEGAKDYVFPVALMTGQGLITVFKNTMLQTFVKTGNYDYLWNSNLNWHLWGNDKEIIIKKDSNLAMCNKGGMLSFTYQNPPEFIPHNGEIIYLHMLLNDKFKDMTTKEIFSNPNSVLSYYDENKD